MSRAPGLRGALWIAMLGSVLQMGCIHNHYYGTNPGMLGCPPVGTTTTQVGSVCEVPSSEVVVSNPSSRAVGSTITPPSSRVSSNDSTMAASRVVISQPSYGPPSVGQVSNRFRWHKLDPETLPSMKAEGGMEDAFLR